MAGLLDFFRSNSAFASGQVFGHLGVRLPMGSEVGIVCFREGFRMPARRDLSTGRGAGVRKPPRKEPAGTCWAVCVYGDLTGRRLQRGLGSASSLGVDCRPSLRIGRCRRTGRCDSATVGGLAWGFAGTGAAVVRRRERHVPAGGWCKEAVRVVMTLRSGPRHRAMAGLGVRRRARKSRR